MKFEESLKELEEIVAKMEQGNLTIDESIAAFTKGIELCTKLLKKEDLCTDLVNFLFSFIK